jgi:four helix bundle protein
MGEHSQADAPRGSGAPIGSYRDLRVWQDAMGVAETCYRVTAGFPKDELFGLTSQIRRSASSIAANIAEGYGRERTATFIQFLRISQGSLKELETHLILAQRVGLSAPEPLTSLVAQCEVLGGMLYRFIRSLEQRLLAKDGS